MRNASQGRRSIVCAYANGAMWGLGSGIASTTLATYLAIEYGANHLALAWLLAAPPLVGLLRLFTPAFLDLVGSRRWFCIAMYWLSSAALAAGSVISAPGALVDSQYSILALGVGWTLYQLMESMGVVALWSWLGDLVPAAVRGRFIGRREASMTAGVVAGASLAALATWRWSAYCERIGAPAREWQGYAACALTGAVVLALAPRALLGMISPRRSQRGADVTPFRMRDLLTPWLNCRFRRLMYFEIWFSAINGFILSVRNSHLASC